MFTQSHDNEPFGPGAGLFWHSSLCMALSIVFSLCHLPTRNVWRFSCSIIHSVYQHLKYAGSSKTYPSCPRSNPSSFYSLQYSWNNRAVEPGEDLWPLHITCLESSNMGNSSARVISLGWRSSRTVVEAVSEHEECFFRGIQYAACLEWGDGNNHGVRGCPKLKLSCQKSGSWRSLDVNYDVIYSYKPRLLGVTVYEVAVSSALFFTFFLLGSCSLPVKLVVNKKIKYAPIFCSW